MDSYVSLDQLKSNTSMIEQKIEQLLSRLNEIEDVLAHSAVFSDQKKYRAITEEHAYLTEIKTTWDALASLDKQREDNRELLKVERDLDFAEVLREDIADIDKRYKELQEKLENILIPPDPNDHRNTIIEIRAGTGGDEAALFVGDCVRMYKLYADRNNWRYEPISCTESEVGGYKEYVMVLSGQNVFRFLQYEGGTHRVQRVPATEAQGRVHTSAITIAVIAEPDEDVDIVIDEKDLRVDTYRSSGAGGQHVNTTDSAVRITHMPSGIAVYCQEERSQHKNKDKAMRLLKAKLATAELEKKQAALSETRSSQVGSGDRSERIRTYNFPQNRLTDHRINLTKYNLDHIMDGDLDTVTKSLVAHYRQEQLKS